MVNVLVLSLLLQLPGVLWVDDDRKSIPEPKEREISATYDFVSGTFLEPMAQVGDMPRNFRKLFRHNKEAENINTVDEVPNSSWFTNRNFLHPMTAEEIMHGPDGKLEPAAGEWVVEQCKIGGVSQGLRVRDRDNDLYILKFDPPEFPEMSTAADVIGSKILFAAGYNVPANSIVEFDTRNLKLKPGAQCKDKQGAMVPMDEAFMERFFQTVARQPDGKIRGMASKYLDGKPKGPFSYVGWRNDDPNDVIAHEHRRELRGLKVIASFINHTDVKQLNTLDMYVDEDGRKFLKHHLIDFGASLGSATTTSKDATEGHEYLFDTSEVLKNVATLGLRHRREDEHAQPIHPAIGFLQGESGFDPAAWKPHLPVPAFENMTDRDAYWGAKIVASFTDDQIRAAIRSANYSDPVAGEMLFEILRQRRDKIAEYWFRKVAPLDRFTVLNNKLHFDDLAVLGGYDTTGDASYTVTLRTGSKTEVLRIGPGADIPLPLPSNAKTTIAVQIARASSGWPEQKVTVRVAQNAGRVEVVEVQR